MPSYRRTGLFASLSGGTCVSVPVRRPTQREQYIPVAIVSAEAGDIRTICPECGSTEVILWRNSDRGRCDCGRQWVIHRHIQKREQGPPCIECGSVTSSAGLYWRCKGKTCGRCFKKQFRKKPLPDRGTCIDCGGKRLWKHGTELRCADCDHSVSKRIYLKGR